MEKQSNSSYKVGSFDGGVSLLAKRRLWFVAAATLLYAGLLLFTRGLRFAPKLDELHFWPTSLLFSHRWAPTLANLRSYNELNTPLPFLMFGWVEHCFHQGIAAGRALNVLLSFLIVLEVGMPRDSGTRSSVIAAAGLLVFPYYLGVSAHLYTDIPAAFFVILGMAAYRARRHCFSATSFALAIACRQYMVAFPIAIALHEFGRSGHKRPRLSEAWIAPLAAAATMLGWFALFGGPAPRVAILSQNLPTAQFAKVFPAHGLYFLSCVGLYFVLPERILFGRESGFPPPRRRDFAIALGLALLFWAFPPLGNVDYFTPTMGYMDKFVRLFTSDIWRLVIFYVLALTACVRFDNLGLEALLVYANALMMIKAHIAWDKYALPLLAVLWYMKATEGAGGVNAWQN